MDERGCLYGMNVIGVHFMMEGEEYMEKGVGSVWGWEQIEKVGESIGSSGICRRQGWLGGT